MIGLKETLQPKLQRVLQNGKNWDTTLIRFGWVVFNVRVELRCGLFPTGWEPPPRNDTEIFITIFILLAFLAFGHVPDVECLMMAQINEDITPSNPSPLSHHKKYKLTKYWPRLALLNCWYSNESRANWLAHYGTCI